jgi:hypothetical protein
MPKYAYLDTNAFRYFGKAFENARLPDDLRDRVLISPLSAFEVFAQLADELQGDQVLKQVRAIRNWTNPNRSGLLPWPDDWLYQVWHGKVRENDEFAHKVQSAFNMCLAADSVSSFREIATDHKKLMDDFKLAKAEQFKALLDAARVEKVREYDMTRDWFESIARSVNADPMSKPVAEIIDALSAHYEFEKVKLQRALTDPKYNPLSRKNQNDIIDVDQLVYLCDPSLFMITADSGFASKSRGSHQAARIITAPALDLMDPDKAESLLRATFNSHA